MHAKEHQNRRKKLAAALPEGALALVSAAPESLRNGDSHYRFRQDSDFYYLTGFEEPEAFAVLAGGKFTLFVRPRDPEREIWDGRRAGTDGALRDYGAHEAFPVTEFETRLPAMIAD